MKYFRYLLIIIIIISNCSYDKNYNISDNKNKEEYQKPYSNDLISHEMTLGGENVNLKDEFILVSPSSYRIRITKDEDILLVDEDIIKVYDKRGIGKKIIGRQGLGPGEFEGEPFPLLGPEGHILAFTSSGFIYNLFAPDYTFIEKKRLYGNTRLDAYIKSFGSDFIVQNIREGFPVNEYEKVYSVRFKNKSEAFISIIHENSQKIVPILHLKEPGVITTKESYGFFLYIGMLYWELLPGRRIIYINTDEDKHDEKIGSYYTIHIISIDSNEDKKIIHQFNPIKYPDNLSKKFPLGREFPILQKELDKIFKNKKYFPSVEMMTIDGHYAFVFLYKYKDANKKETNNNERFVDIFDLNNEKFIGSYIFPSRFNTIKYGYAYDGNRDQEGFAEIRKYKINPIVYGLPEDPDWKTKK